jgi:hypothetical protein
LRRLATILAVALIMSAMLAVAVGTASAASLTGTANQGIDNSQNTVNSLTDNLLNTTNGLIGGLEELI